MLNADCKLVLLDKGGLLPVEGTHFKLSIGLDPAEEALPWTWTWPRLLDKDGIYNNFVYFHQQSAPAWSTPATTGRALATATTSGCGFR